jgi:hypothetical protein
MTGTHPWSVPHVVELRGAPAGLAWREGEGAGRWDEVEAPLDLLERFMGQAEATDAQLLAFAKIWGPLRLCDEHRLPVAHDLHRLAAPWPAPLRRHARAPVALCPTRTLRPSGAPKRSRTLWEPCAEWRGWAREARAILDSAARLNQGAIPLARDWETAQRRSQSPERAAGRRLEELRMTLSIYLDQWALFADVRPLVRWVGPRPIHSLGSGPYPGPYGSLFGALAVQLADRVLQVGPVLCAGCGRRFEPNRPPRPRERLYCARRACKRARDATLKREQRERDRREGRRRRWA